MTEEEMKQTWCPDARVAEDDSPPYNRLWRKPDAVPVGAQCLGSKCSAWRWQANEPKCEVHAGDPARPFITTTELAQRRLYTVIRVLPREGYCGRAGRPA